MAEKADFYETLGVNRNASGDDIKKAYRRLAKKYHPDINNGDSSSEAKFKEITAAYEVLSDPDKRSKYDTYGHRAFEQGGFEQGFGGFSDIFESFFGSDLGGFGFGGTQRRRQGPMKGADLRYRVEVTFEEAAFGVEKELNISRAQSCDDCEGTGMKAETGYETCRHCGGTGEVRYNQATVLGSFVSVKTCDVCRGEGKIIKDPCNTCSGKGRVRKNVKISVNIPAGIDNGQAISLRGEGDLGQKGGPPGDLLIEVYVKPHEIFIRQGRDIFCEMPITFVQGALGASVEIPTLEGKIPYDIPEGTQTGTEFRIRGKGIPSLRGGQRGDLYIKVNVEVPRRLNEKQKELLRNFAEISGDEVHEGRRTFFDKMRNALGL